MPQLDRRTFLRGSAATAGAVMLGGPFQGFVARAANAAARNPPSRSGRSRTSGTGRPALAPERAPVPLVPRHGGAGDFSDGTALPGRHDGMAAFPGPGENVLLVRNHEVNGPGTPFGPGTPYDSAARGGTTTIEVTPKGKVVDSYTSLNGTQMNCSGGPMPWGSWITCENDQRARRRPGLHRCVERAAPEAARVHLRRAGGRAVDPRADHGGG